jgi:4-hydroxy-tetrahydrodipicolinate reductase
MTRIAVFGAKGRMGSLVVADILSRTTCAYAENIENADVVIDFTRADATPDLIKQAASLGKPYVCCTTGLADMAPLHDAAKTIPVLYAANTSLSLAAAKQAVALMAKILTPFGYDIAVHEEHHTLKKDAPSGTALVLGHAAGGNVAYTSVRAGNIVGEHEVLFAGDSELIRLRHSVTDRRVFARGAVEAALWLAGKSEGFYSMEDVLRLSV